jgi:transcription initiation factor TFIIB
MKNNISKPVCPRCSGERIVSDQEQGELICSECGFVVQEEIVDRGPEWRAFTPQERDRRTRTGLGESYTLYDKGLSTVFGGNRDGKGKRLNISMKIKMDRLKRYDNRAKFDETWRRNLSIAMAELDRMATKLHLPQQIKENSAFLYRKALKKDIIRGRSIEAFVAACIYAACRQAKIPRPLRTVARLSTRDYSEVARTYRLILQELDLKMPVDGPLKFVPSIASKLGLKRRTEQYAIKILTNAREQHALAGKDPRGLAAAALYLASIENDDKRIQKDVATAAGTTEVTLRNRLRGLEETLKDNPIETLTEATPIS